MTRPTLPIELLRRLRAAPRIGETRPLLPEGTPLRKAWKHTASDAQARERHESYVEGPHGGWTVAVETDAQDVEMIRWLKSHWRSAVAVVATFAIGAVSGVVVAGGESALDRQESRIASLSGDLREAEAKIDELSSLRADAEKYRRHHAQVAAEARAAAEAKLRPDDP